VTSLSRGLSPRSVAIIGASADPTRLSGRPLRILCAAGFDGAVFAVNPRHKEIAGQQAYPDVVSVPGPVDTALILVPKAHVMSVLRQCADADVGTAVVFTSGFAEEGAEGSELEAKIRQIAVSSSMRVLGPNAEGFLNAHARVAATFSPAVERSLQDDQFTGADNLAVLSQSGGLGFAVYDRGCAAGLGFGYVVSTGNEADVDVTELVDELLSEGSAGVFLLVVEGFKSPERFLAVAERARAAGKPIVVAKLGTSEAGARAALAHTAHLVGSPPAERAAFRACGVVQAEDEDELVDLGMLFARSTPSAGSRVGIITTSGGAGVWLADSCAVYGLTVPELGAGIQRDLRKLMPSFGSPRNPVDVTADAIHGDGVAAALARLLASDEIDAVALIMSLASPTALERQRPLLDDVLAGSSKPVLVYGYTRPAPPNVRHLVDLRLPWFPTANRTARALARLQRWESARGLL